MTSIKVNLIKFFPCRRHDVADSLQFPEMLHSNDL